MTNQDILAIALRQSAIDLSCDAEDFLQKENKVVYSKPNAAARKYLELPFDCNLVTYGNNIVASVQPELVNAVSEYINKYAAEHCFETPNMNVLSEILASYGLKICFMAEYFLPDVTILKKLPCKYEIRLLTQEDFSELYLPEWSNALCEKRRDLDILGVGAYEDGKLIGFAGCSADCEEMWQIGIDVLPSYRRQGVAAALTSALALEVLQRGKVPFYCAAWSNIKSVRNAIKSGFRPAWAELTAKSAEFVDKLNEVTPVSPA
uniref:N-acetyltransferase domain-containing protein n=1 Tax=uncultured Bacillota bacterium TaxID=344338 RepID=A0A650EN46_9FIRM|nr:hypothetical protein Firmicute1046_2750 [uncultured Firmicutes bacterium]